MSGGPMATALRHAPLRRLLAALAASQAGDWLYNTALLAFVFERTHSTAWLGLVTVMRVLPIVVLGPLGGVVADRFDRRLVMIVCDVLRAAIMLALVAAAILQLPVVLAPALAALATAASAPYPSCTAASLVRLVPDADLPGANAARAVIGPLCVVGGPALGALLLLLGPAWVVFAINAATFVVSALLVAGIAPGAWSRAPKDTAPATDLAAGIASPAARWWADLLDGGRALLSNRSATRLVSADVLCSMLYGVETVALVVIGARLGLSAQGYGVLLAAVGAGSVLGSIVAPRLARLSDYRAVVAGALTAAALPIALLPLVGDVGIAILLAAATGLASMVVEILAETVLQRTLDDAVFARAYGFAFPASIGGIAVGAVVTAPLIAWCGLPLAMAVIAAVVVGYAGLTLRSAAATPAAVAVA
jgi:MFS family permease